jgi:hypothetical protein
MVTEDGRLCTEFLDTCFACKDGLLEVSSLCGAPPYLRGKVQVNF